MAITRITKRRKEKTLDDRLSSLSDHLLLFILSNLETLEAVKTCVLSQRWRNLWKSLPNLSFLDLPYGTFRHYTEKLERIFLHFITQVLLRRDNSDLVKFVLFPPSTTEPYLVESWLEYAVKHNVKFISYYGVCEQTDQNKILLPRCFFDCSSLEGLELQCQSYRSITWPRHFNWPALKSLYLQDFIVGEGNFDGRIFSSCPSLETLKLNSLHTHMEEKIFSIRSLSLRSLELVNWGLELVNWGFDHHGKSDPTIVVVAPKLTTFKFGGYKPVICSVHAPSLHNVTINLRPQTGVYSPSSFDENDPETVLGSIKMVNEFLPAKSLCINAEAFQVLSALPDLLELHLRKFENLKELNLMIPIGYPKRFPFSPGFLSYFLSSSTTLNLICVENAYL